MTTPTPQERAEQFVKEWLPGGSGRDYERLSRAMTEMVALHITAAVAEGKAITFNNIYGMFSTMRGEVTGKQQVMHLLDIAKPHLLGEK